MLLLGPIESAAKRIAIMGIANKIAGGLGSVIFGAILLSGIDGIKDKLSEVEALKKNPEKEYILWPNRVDKIEQFEDLISGIIK